MYYIGNINIPKYGGISESDISLVSVTGNSQFCGHQSYHEFSNPDRHGEAT